MGEAPLHSQDIIVGGLLDAPKNKYQALHVARALKYKSSVSSYHQYNSMVSWMLQGLSKIVNMAENNMAAKI